MKSGIDIGIVPQHSIRRIGLLLVAAAELCGLIYSSNGMALEVASQSQAHEDGFGVYDGLEPSGLSIASTSAVNAGPHSSTAAWSTVDARSGTLRGFASVHVTDPAYRAGAVAYGSMREIITIGLPDGPIAPGNYSINLLMPYDFQIVDGNSGGSFFLALSLRRCENVDCTEGYAVHSYAGSAEGSSVVDSELVASVPIDFIHTTYEVFTWFQAYVNAGFPYGGTDRMVDFSSTATLSLSLPEGFTYTALSPDFLNPVPLPGALLPFTFSLLCCAVAMRRSLGNKATSTGYFPISTGS